MPSSSRKSACLFWMSYAVLASYLVVALLPDLHCPGWLEKLLLVTFLAGFFVERKNITFAQTVFSIATGAIGCAFGIACLWDSWTVILLVPAFLLLSLCLFFMLRIRWRNQRGTQQLLTQ